MNDTKEIYDHFNRLQRLPKDDGEKHRELSCIGGQKNPHGTVAVSLAGLAKEGYDITKKSFNSSLRKKNGGFIGVLADSKKDLTNNLKGLSHGLFNSQEDCEEWAKKK